MKFGFQTTLADRVEIAGCGVHSGAPARLVLHPAGADSGIVILRTGLPGERERLIEANWRNVKHTALCTVLGDSTGATVSTVEHLLATLSGLGIDNAMIEIDGAEIPIMDGSAARFIDAIDAVGVVTQARRRRYVRVLKPIVVEQGRSRAELRPCSKGFHLDIEIDFEAAAIGRQRRRFDVDPQVFRKDISRARTFGFVSDVKKLWQAGFALGSSLENSVALDGEDILNPEGLRYADEFVRHKALDALGDLSLAGAPIIGAYHAYRPGHALNAAMLSALFSDRSAYEFITTAPSARRPTRSASPVGRVAAAFAASLD